MRPRIAWVAAVAVASSCGTKDVPFWIDNPTASPARVRVDQRELTLAPLSGTMLKLSRGRHTLTSEATGQVAFMVYAGKGVLLNPTLSTYVVYNEVYAVNDRAAERFHPWEQTIELDGVEFTGPISKREGLFIDQDWRYGVTEALPEVVTVGPGSDGNIHGKLFRLEDFVRFFERAMDDEGRYEAERRPRPRSPFVATPLTIPPSAGGEAWNEALAPLRALTERRLRAATVAEQEATSKAYFDAVMALTRYRAGTEAKLPVDEVKRRQADVQALMEPFSHTVLVLPK
jgi:hypothetical protein